MRSLAFSVIAGERAIVRLGAGADLPPWLDAASPTFLAVTRTARETSIVCDAVVVPHETPAERGWALIELRGPFAFSEVGVLAAIARPLADAGIALFAISTFDTDYVLVRTRALDHACDVLVSAGHRRESA